MKLYYWCTIAFISVVYGGDDYYEILGIGKDADNREIRKAFKKLALTMHPDKSKEPDAQEKFLKINKAYETLKDEEKRKHYDRFGEEDEEGGGKQNYKNYQSWNYYRDDFGLYDDDPDIVTLDYHDFRRSVSDSFNYWFINYYSPQCSHCHDLAPVWRKIARALKGIVRIGAVNCQDDFMLCRQQNIQSYPSLIFYGPEGVIRFQGPKEEEELIQFVVENLPDKLVRLRTANFEKVVLKVEEGEEDDEQPWVILFCVENDFKCPEKKNWNLLTSMLHGLAKVGVVDCQANKKLCEEHTQGDFGTYYFGSKKDVKEKEGKRLRNTEYGEIAEEVLEMLPDIPMISDEKYSKFRLRLEDNLGPSWLIHFVFGDDGRSVDEKRIPSLLMKNVKFARLDCNKQAANCRELGIKKPIFVSFKIGGGYEYHFGREMPSDVAEFARKAALARNMVTLTSKQFPDILKSQGVFVDFFAPWCPPCLNLLPEYRKASVLVGGSIVFGLVDCTSQPKICNQFNIRSYPTTIFFNNSKPHQYQGEHSAETLADFVHEILKPSVTSLTYHSFYKQIGGKTQDEMWLVDFYAPWCGPCMQLAPQWTKLAKMMKRIPEVKVAKVDCTVEQELCRDQAVRSYPSLRMYPLGTPGLSKYFVYTGFHRDAQSLREWVLQSLPSFTEQLTPHTFQQKVIGSSRPAIIDFYTPWCGHCQHFSPVFDDIALEVRDKVLAGKLNCERFSQLCRQLGIRAYPTVRFYSGNTDQGVEVPTRQFQGLLDFIHDMLDRNVRRKIVTHDEL